MFNPLAEIFETSFSVPPPTPKTMKLLPQVVGETGGFRKPEVNAF